MATLAQIEQKVGTVVVGNGKTELKIHYRIAGNNRIAGNKHHCLILPHGTSVKDCILQGCEESIVVIPNGDFRRAALCPCDDHGECCLCHRGLGLVETPVKKIETNIDNLVAGGHSDRLCLEVPLNGNR